MRGTPALRLCLRKWMRQYFRYVAVTSTYWNCWLSRLAIRDEMLMLVCLHKMMTSI